MSLNIKPHRGSYIILPDKIKVETIKELDMATVDGATFNLDGTPYLGDGLAVSLTSKDYDLKVIEPAQVAADSIEFVEELEDEDFDVNCIKLGLFKFSNSYKMSLDLNLILPRIFVDVAVKFAYWAGQESLWDFALEQCIPSGTTLLSSRPLTIQQCAEASKYLPIGELPGFVAEPGNDDLERIAA